MSQARLPMQHAREILRLSREKGMTGRAIAQSLSLSPTTVSKYLKQLEPVPWPLPEPGSEALLAKVLEKKKVPAPSARVEPDWAQVHRELQSHRESPSCFSGKNTGRQPGNGDIPTHASASITPPMPSA